MNQTKVILPAADKVNPVAIVDCEGSTLSDVLGYCSRSMGWSRVLLPMADESIGRGRISEIGELMPEQVERSSLEHNIESLPDKATIRRIIIGNAVLATISQPDGTVLDNAIEAVNALDDPPVLLSPGFYEDDEDWDDDELDDEDEDIDEDEDEGLEDGDDDDYDDDDEETGAPAGKTKASASG